MEFEENRNIFLKSWIQQTNCSFAILDAATSMKARGDQLRQTTRDLRTRVAKCIEVYGGNFRIFIVHCNKSVL